MISEPLNNRRAWSMLLGAAIALSLTGCAAPGAIGYKLFGPNAVEAKYKPAQVPMLVLVENYRQGAASAQDADSLTQLIEAELKEHKVAPLIDSSVLHDLRSRKQAEYRNLTIPQVGREVGAQQVLYVDLIESTVEVPPGTEMMQGRLKVLVRVVDVATGNSLWPTGTDGMPLAVQTPYAKLNDPHQQITLRRTMFDDMSTQISHLFYKYKPEDLKEEREE